MTSPRLVLALVAGCCLLRPAPLTADTPAAPVAPPAPSVTAAPPFAMEKQYSADVEVVMKSGMTVESKTFVEGDKMRSNVSMNGMSMAIIVRKDQKKIYQIMEAQKMIMESPLDPTKIPGGAGAFGPEGKFDLLGNETVAGVPCVKYKVTPDNSKQVYLLWYDEAHKVPVEMASADGALTVKWKNFVPGPQAAALFEPPAGYQVMEMPQGMGMPGSGGGMGGADGQ
jgi:hypothetical protein